MYFSRARARWVRYDEKRGREIVLSCETSEEKSPFALDNPFEKEKYDISERRRVT